MRIPLATYRVQLHHEFTFAHVQEVSEYLVRLGITDIYASPFLKAKKGSRHGYDVVDATQINPELGGSDGFTRLCQALRNQGLGWIQDLVPNHMAFDCENRLLMDIFENGPVSKYYHFFDIDWDHPYENLKGKVLVPFLGEFYGTCLDNAQVQLMFDEDGFSVRYYDWRLPLRLETYHKVLAARLMALEEKVARDDKEYIQFLEILQALTRLETISDTDERYSSIALIKSRLWSLYSSHPAIKAYVDATVTAYNGTPHDPQSFNALDELLSEQVFRLAFWKVGNEELNYRRFFTINGLICLRMEQKEVFEYMHALVMQRVKEGRISGLRVDHIDGLYDPVSYAKQLRQRDEQSYIVVEKILDQDERLPASLPVQGTTGYDALNLLNGVFIRQESEKKIQRAYETFAGMRVTYRQLVSDKKRLFMGKHMAGDMDNLAHLLKRILEHNRYGKDMTMYALRRAIVELMAQFPVYRSYVAEEPAREEDAIYIKEAVARAQNNSPGLVHELNFIAKVLLLDFSQDVSREEKEKYYHFTKRFQQFSGPLMAKGAEDTTFYIYNRFISLNEVGGNPAVFGVSLPDFHERMTTRQKNWPHTMNATATHDTKRGEDMRARLNVLSELPQDWTAAVRAWSKLNRKKKRGRAGMKMPDANDEYFIYQTLVGGYPFDAGDHDRFCERMQEYIVKAIREAKVHTAWIKPDSEYENACRFFIESLLHGDEAKPFMDAFMPFQKKIAFYGIFNSLSQLLLKTTIPGVPDIYQGTELWDLSLVDPDNRRPVDYQRRQRLLSDITARATDSAARMRLIGELFQQPQDGAIKLFLLHALLRMRQKYTDIFLRGDYIPLQVNGARSQHVIAFARRHDEAWAVSIAPRLLTGLVTEHVLPVGDEVWQDTAVVLPRGAPRAWEEVITGRHVSAAASLRVGDSCRHMPVAVLVGTGALPDMRPERDSMPHAPGMSLPEARGLI